MPIRADTKIPIKSGCITVAVFTRFPKAVIKADTPGPTNCAARIPEVIVIPGVTRMSTGVSFDTILPSSAAMIVATSAPTGPPSSFPAIPTVAAENRTRVGALSAYAIETPRAAPVALFAYPAIRVKISMPVLSPSVPKMVPIKREANRPKAIAPRASIRYVCTEMTTCFRLRKAFTCSIFINPH